MWEGKKDAELIGTEKDKQSLLSEGSEIKYIAPSWCKCYERLFFVINTPKTSVNCHHKSLTTRAYWLHLILYDYMFT